MNFPFATVALLMFCVSTTVAQQRPQYTQYMFNGLIINPAYAGADEALSLTLLNRSQWVSIDGAPVTQTLSAHTLFAKSNLGVGLSFVNDKIGVHRNQFITASAAYHLPVSETGVLSFGLQGGVNMMRANYNSLNLGTGTTTDPKLLTTGYNGTYANLGVGFYYRSKRFNLGVSAPDLLPEKYELSDTATITWQNAQYFIYSKYRFTLNNNFDLEPSVLLKYHQGVPLSFDVNVCVTYKQALTAGVSYRHDESVDFLLRARLTPQLQFGYSYDFATGDVSAQSKGTHELMVAYLFTYNRTKIVSPR